MLKIGPNPYGIACTLGLQGKNPAPKDLTWYIGLAEEMHGRCIEFHFGMLSGLSEFELNGVGDRLRASSLDPVISGPWPLSRIPEAFPIARRLGVRTIRTHLSPVLCGARAEQGDLWERMVAEIRADLADLGPKFHAEGLTLAIENHQDFGSGELVEFCGIGGPSVGITLDTGNPLAVGEDPTAFAKRVAPWVRHVHLKDYRAQATAEGFRLVRCAIGDGAIPFSEIVEILSASNPHLTAALEPGALEARHVKLLTKDWWRGYSPLLQTETAGCIEATRRNALPVDQDWRTPWESGESPEVVCRFEMDQMMKSVQNMRYLGWLPT